jgi:NitT/TauT family transport system permease protein
MTVASNSGAEQRAVPTSLSSVDPAPPDSSAERLALQRWWWLSFARKARPWVLGAASIAIAVLAWHLLTRYRVQFYVRFSNIPSPEAVFESAQRVMLGVKYFNNMLRSMQRILLGFALATVLGISLGLVLGWYRLARELVFPTAEILRPIPAIAWVPMSIMLWPTAESSMVFITFLGAFFPILLNTMQGVHDLDPVFIRAARSLGANQRALFIDILLPGVLPSAFTGLSVGMGVAWVSLIAAEMISGQFGIGYFTWEAYSLIQYADIAVGMITIGVLGLLCSGIIRLIGKLVMPWDARGAQR